MTMTDRQSKYFGPKDGESSLRDKVLDGIRALPPLEQGTVITYGMIAEWIGEPFPRRVGEFGERSYAPMVPAVRDVLLTRGVFLLNVEGDGYKVATDAERIEWAERNGYLAAMETMQYAVRVLGTVDRSRVTDRERSIAGFLEIEMREEQRVMREKLKAASKEAARWA